jgi:hypothetical protein
MYTAPTVSDFKTYFVRDFPYGTEQTSVTDADITKALTDAGINFNPALWATQATYSIGYMLLAAHFMVMSFQSSSQGISGQFSWLESSKSVGSVSEGFTIPQRILDNPEFAWLSKTNYGAKYLMLVMPQLAGQMYVVCGGTKA